MQTNNAKTTAPAIRLGGRFNGPPTSANGGYAAGSLAAFLEGPAEVTLWRPPPVERDLSVASVVDGVTLWEGPDLVAEAHPATVDLTVPPAPSISEARSAAQGYLFRDRHPFATCFVCGPDRVLGDGMRIFPGPLGRDGVIASSWICPVDLGGPRGEAANEIVWAALDCPSGLATAQPDEMRPLVLARMAAEQRAPICVGVEYVVLGWPLGLDGRKRYGGAAIYSGVGELLALAKALWIELRP